MPVNAKGRLKYLDFLSRFSSERAATPPDTDDSAKAQRGSSVPNVSAESSPTGDPKAGSKPRSHPCVSSPSHRVTCCLAPQIPLGGGPSVLTGWG